MKWVELVSVTVIAGMSVASLAEDVVFRSVDDNGQVVFSDRPADGKLHESVDLKVARPQAASDNAQQQDEYLQKAVSLREQQDADAAEDEDRIQADVAAQRQANCSAARSRAEKYNTHRRLYRPLPGGEREYLDDAELDAARAEAARTVDEWCS